MMDNDNSKQGRSDIRSRADIEHLVNSFYEKVGADDLLGMIFNDIAKVDWPKHLPIMYSFWENLLLGTAEFKGNPMTPHLQLNRIFPLKEEHFQRWLKLFFATVDEHFDGKVADEAKSRAGSIAGIMQFKIGQEKI